MKFSLIMATLGRQVEIIDNLFLSLKSQSYKNFEVIVIDQNEDQRMISLIEKYKTKIKIIYVRSEKGLSKARNIGMKYISGNIVCFPDDDCIYEVDTLMKVKEHFENNGILGVTGRSVYEFSSFKNREAKTKKINRYNIWFRSISYTIFLRKECLDKIGLFDEKLGVGSGTKYGSGEETDFLLRALSTNMGSVIYDSDIEIKHPIVDFRDPNIIRKAYNYSAGRMYVLKKHKYNNIFILLNILYPLFKYFYNLKNKNKRKYYFSQFKGRYENKDIHIIGEEH
ncbi:glycosyltransferase family 2 protein [Bacillus sp. IITD106]|nr:glycosyltransferase family 2 protein [Bacillus sp. IITD106]